MNCEEGENLISARTDGEMPGDDPAAVALDAHLAACAGCRAAAEAMQLQDATLVRAFAPARRSAEAVAERAVMAMLGDQSAPLPPHSLAYARVPPARFRIAGLAAAAVAAAVVLGTVVLGLRLWRSASSQVAATLSTPAPLPVAQLPAQPVWQVALSTPDVFTCPSHKTDEWQPVAAGAALAGGDRVRTGPGVRVELVLADGSQVRLNGGTEARLDDARCVELKQGQLWSAVPQEAQPLRVIAPPPGEGSTVSATNPPGSRLDFSCAPSGSVLTAVHGPAKLTDKRGAEMQVPAGTAMTLVDGLPSGRSSPGDVLLATRWLDDLLVLKGRDDPELTARVNELLRGSISNPPPPRARPPRACARPRGATDPRQGDRWSEPLACHVQSPASRTDRATRLTAARLLADLAPPSAIPDLISLLGDRDGEVRFHAAKALHRLTGQNLGRTPEQCATDAAESVQQTHKKWLAWWEQNKVQYGKQKSGG